jgi:Protein of unknown function (DUF2934)
MNRDLDEGLIRERAHALWEAEGRPEGCEEEHWYKALRELAGSSTAKPNATRARRPKPAGARSKKAA